MTEIDLSDDDGVDPTLVITTPDKYTDSNLSHPLPNEFDKKVPYPNGSENLIAKIGTVVDNGDGTQDVHVEIEHITNKPLTDTDAVRDCKEWLEQLAEWLRTEQPDP